MTENPEFEDYSSTYQDYDERRATPAWSIIEHELSELANRLDKPISELVVLDAGCGTGLYTDKVKNIVQKVIALDQNDGMLKRCREKFSGCGNVTIMKGSLLEKLPIPDESVDIVLINQVLHHLENAQTISSWSNTSNLMQELSRVLVPGGLLAINHCSSQQTLHGCWYFGLFPEYAEVQRKRYIDEQKLEHILLQSCFENVKSHKLHASYCKDEFDLEGPLKKEFRQADSFWASIQEDDLENGLDKWRKKLNNKNETTQFIEEREKLHHKYGASYEIFCSKKD